MAGDSGDIEQYRAHHPRKRTAALGTPFQRQYNKQLEKEYQGLTRTEIDNKVRQQAAHIAKSYTLQLNNGKTIRATVRNRDIEHFTNDALFKTSGKLKLSDIRNVNLFLENATYIGTTNAYKGNSSTKYHTFSFMLRGNELYFKVKEAYTQDPQKKNGKERRPQTMFTIHSINDKR